jgi:hypothetical protein
MTKPAETPVLSLADGYPFDLTRLMESRLLVTAASGGGKSRLLRRLLEQVAPHVPVIVIDPEGEFHTLREKFEILVCAPSGADAVATSATAPLLARFILEQGISAVFNIYDLKSSERLEFVRILCETLVNARQELWRNVLIVMDEAHIFCPEGGKSEVGQAVIDLATRGRKRGFCLCLATQRLAALDKNAAAQMLNKFIGGNTMKLDIKRAADELGEPLKEMDPKIRALTPGQFYARGPALPAGVHLFKAGPVVTTHPSPGKRFLAPPAPGPKIRALLEDRLKDLPKQAVEEAITMEQLRDQLRESQIAVKRLVSQTGPQGIPEAEVQARIAAATRIARNEGFDTGVAAAIDKAKKLRQGLQDLLDSAHADMDDPNKILAEILQENTPEIHRMANGQGVALGGRPTAAEHETGGNSHVPARPFTPAAARPVKRDGVSAPQQTILDVLAQFDTYGNRTLNRTTLAVQAGVSSNSSGFQKNLSTLRTMGLIDYPNGGTVILTDAGREAARFPARARTLGEFHDQWFRMVSGPQAAILRQLIAFYNRPPFTRANLATMVQVSENSSGFQKNLSTLHTMGAIEYPQSGYVKASALMFPQGVK